MNWPLETDNDNDDEDDDDDNDDNNDDDNDDDNGDDNDDDNDDDDDTDNDNNDDGRGLCESPSFGLCPPSLAPFLRHSIMHQHQHDDDHGDNDNDDDDNGDGDGDGCGGDDEFLLSESICNIWSTRRGGGIETIYQVPATPRGKYTYLSPVPVPVHGSWGLARCWRQLLTSLIW